MTNVKEELWYKDPFGWYEQNNKPEIYGVQMTENVALDFLHGLNDIYISLKANEKEQAARDAEILATLLIASAMRVGQEVIEELLSEEFDSLDIDKEVMKLTEELNDDEG